MFDEMRFFYLKSIPLFCMLPEHQLKGVHNVIKFKQVNRGETVDYGTMGISKIFFLVKGKIKLTEHDEFGNELVKDILTEGEIFGDMELEGDPRDDEFAEVLTSNTIICFFNVSDFRNLLESNPLLAMGYAKKISVKLKRVEGRHADLVFLDAKSRLIRFIGNWARMDGSKVGDKIVLNNYLTHNDIANFISTSRQSVNILLNELRSSGILHYSRKKIELNDPMAWN